MGPGGGTKDPRFETHRSYYREMAKIQDVLIIENVPEYDIDIPESLLGETWCLQHLVIDPRVLGVPAARARRYILAFNKTTVNLVGDLFFSCTD